MEQTLLQLINDEMLSVEERLATKGISEGHINYLMGQLNVLLKVQTFLLKKGARA